MTKNQIPTTAEVTKVLLPLWTSGQKDLQTQIKENLFVDETYQKRLENLLYLSSKLL